MKVKQIVFLFILVTLNACTCAMALKASIGVGAYDALSQTISYLFDVKVGTIGIMLNCSCVFGEWLILKREFQIRHILQVPVCLVLGMVVNYVLYSLMTFSLNNYIFRVGLLLCAYIFMAIICGGIMALDIVTFPLEGLCMACSKKYNLSFAKIRQGVDIVCILISLIITSLLQMDFVIREGTIIGMIIFAPMMNYAMKKEKKLFIKLGMIDNV
ncbi:MAG: hypothetical protein KHZ15_05475 [Coprobacillus cateniformis]|uniref:YczE/YyaS/YitT family protein n=1 Tax=Longibaculum muris TaxID=1796628 RepID=UPI0029FF01F2|nr:hypothetical protein [Coprobacillus cateniformis]